MKKGEVGEDDGDAIITRVSLHMPQDSLFWLIMDAFEHESLWKAVVEGTCETVVKEKTIGQECIEFWKILYCILHCGVSYM